MKTKILMAAIAACIGGASLAVTITEIPVLRTSKPTVKMRIDGAENMEIEWNVSPEINPDVFSSAAASVSFIAENDSVTISLDDWQKKPLNIITEAGDTAHVLVERIASDPYTTPDPAMLRRSASGLLSRRQAEFDIRALIYTIDQVHPDIFSVCRQEDLMRAVNSAIASLPDSLTVEQLYTTAAPLVAMIGDGHTNLFYPNQIFSRTETRHMPVYVRVLGDGTVKCTSSLDSIIPRDARILSINGIPCDTIVESMLPYVSGERRPFRMSRINYTFITLYKALYGADRYDVEYLPEGAKRPLRHTFEPTTLEEAYKRCPTNREAKHDDYSFEIDSIRCVAIMDFRSFEDSERMEAFADSMFRTLRERKIPDLVIDIRRNGGGTSDVGDVLLRYISPIPFVQMDKALTKVTPTTIRLMGSPMAQTGLRYNEADSTAFHRPLTDDEGHYDGNVYLLVSNNTFSSAASFAWAFKECNMGTVVGEESGGMNVCYGDIMYYPMPVSGIYCAISFKRFWQLHADERDIHGVIPDIAVPADDALDTALRRIAVSRVRR